MHKLHSGGQQCQQLPRAKIGRRTGSACMRHEAVASAHFWLELQLHAVLPAGSECNAGALASASMPPTWAEATPCNNYLLGGHQHAAAIHIGPANMRWHPHTYERQHTRRDSLAAVHACCIQSSILRTFRLKIAYLCMHKQLHHIQPCLRASRADTHVAVCMRGPALSAAAHGSCPALATARAIA